MTTTPCPNGMRQHQPEWDILREDPEFHGEVLQLGFYPSQTCDQLAVLNAMRMLTTKQWHMMSTNIGRL